MITNSNTSLEELVIALPLAIALEIALAQPPPLWHYGRQIRGAPAYTLSSALPPQILKLQSFGHLETICWISSWTTLDLENNLAGKKLYDLFFCFHEINGNYQKLMATILMAHLPIPSIGWPIEKCGVIPIENIDLQTVQLSGWVQMVMGRPPDILFGMWRWSDNGVKGFLTLKGWRNDTTSHAE